MSRLAVVTGAAGTIGSALTAALLERGWSVVAVDISPDALGGLGSPDRLVPVVADLTDPAGRRAVVDAVGGRLDVLVNNAGIVLTTPFEEATQDEVARELDVNYRAPLLLTHALYPALRVAGGQVVSVASIGAFVPLAESPGYSASKAALRTLMAGLSQRTRTTGVRVSVVNPSSVDTAMLRHEAATGGSALNFLGTPLRPEQVVDAVLRAVERRGRMGTERDLPAAEGRLVRALQVAPGLTVRVLPLVARAGRRGRRRYAERTTPPSV